MSYNDDYTVNLAKITEKQILASLLPKGFKEIVRESDKYYICNIFGTEMTESKWEKLMNKIDEKYFQSLMHVFPYEDNKNSFAVFIKK